METFVIGHWYLFLALFVVLIALVIEPLLTGASGGSSVSPTDAVHMMNHQAGVVIDVREPHEFQSGHIARAINIPLGQIQTRDTELKKFKERPIIVCCLSGARSARAAALLRKDGFKAVHNLTGGVSAWRSQNLPLES